MSIEPVTLVYDADCSFCLRTLKVLRRLDVMNACRFESSHQTELAERFPSLIGVDLDQAMYAVTDSGDVYRGFFAFRRVAWALPAAWPFLLLLYVPGATLIGPTVYGLVARNRYRLGCESSCEAPGPAGVGKMSPPVD